MDKAVFIGLQSPTDSVYSDYVTEKLFACLDFPLGKKAVGREELVTYREVLSGVRYVFTTWGMYSLTGDEIGRFFPSLEGVFYAAGSVQSFAQPFLSRGISVYSAWAANAVPVAEYTFSQIVLANSGFFGRLHVPGEENWGNRDTGLWYPGNYEATVGIIGAGMIGSMVAEKVKNSLQRMNVTVYDPFLPDERAEKLGVVRCSLEEVFEKSDVITNHLANNAQTVGMLNYRLFSRMKPYATFINTGRGAQVVEEDLCRAMSEVPTRAAVLDVTVSEPPEPGAEFYRLKNVYLTPHIAGSLGNEVHRMAEYMFDEFTRVSRGEKAKYSVTAEMLKTMA